MLKNIAIGRTCGQNIRPSGKGLVYLCGPYNAEQLDPQISGWPLSDAEVAWVSKGEYFRKTGHDAQKHLPEKLSPLVTRLPEQ